ncbi:MAG: hypothetical protein AAFZ52_14370 [Bacteroidota bacterium]
MTKPTLLEIVDALWLDVDPRTGEAFDRQHSCLSDPAVRTPLAALREQLRESAPSEQIPEVLLTAACADLRRLGYDPTVVQLAKVLSGSRTIVDRNLQGLPAYARYRGVYTRRELTVYLEAYRQRHPEQLRKTASASRKTVSEPWRDVPFFREATFDKLEADKAAELREAVTDLALRKTTDSLPEYMARARQNLPRAFEPWTREEKALLIEAMCYTNDAARLAPIFGRSAGSLTTMGQRLIYDSQQRQEVA